MRTLTLATIVSLGAVAACSGPKSPADGRAAAAAPRDLRLVDLAADSAPTSAIEASQEKAAPVARVTAPRPRRTVEPAPIEQVQEAPAALDVLTSQASPTLSTTTAGTLEISTTLAQAPAVPEMFPAGGIRAEVDPIYQGRFGGGITGGGGPRVIIRGGRGGIDDDCDLDRPGHHGAAVNRLGPAAAGGVLRAPIARVGRGRGIR